MRIRVSTTVLGLTAALALPAAAQSTGDSLRTRADSLRADSVRADSIRRAGVTTPGARSDRRIPVTKDRTTQTSTGTVDTTTPQTPAPAPAPVVTPTPVDTATPAPTTPATDSAAMQTTTTVQTDVTTGTATGDVDLEARGVAVRPGGLYFQIGGGAAIPTGDFSQYYHNGWNGTAAIGWQPAASPLGLRLMVGYNRLNGKTFGGANGFELQDPDLWALNVNADWRLARWGMNPHNGFYLTGGAGAYHFRNFGQNALIGSGSGNELATDNDRTTKFGLNGGLGFSFGIGNAAMFVESRYVSIFAKRNGSNTVGGTDAALTYPNFENSTYIPLTIGFRF